MALESGGSANQVRMGGAFVEVSAVDNTKAGLDSAAKNLAELEKKAKAATGGPAGTAQLNTEAIRAQELAKRGAQITKANRTELEKHADTQRELNELLKAGAVSQVTFGRASKQAAADLRAAQNAKVMEGPGGQFLGMLGVGGLSPVALAGGAALAAGGFYASNYSSTGIGKLERARAVGSGLSDVRFARTVEDLGVSDTAKATRERLAAYEDEKKRAEKAMNAARARAEMAGVDVSEIGSGSINSDYAQAIKGTTEEWEKLSAQVEQLRTILRQQTTLAAQTAGKALRDQGLVAGLDPIAGARKLLKDKGASAAALAEFDAGAAVARQGMGITGGLGFAQSTSLVGLGPAAAAKQQLLNAGGVLPVGYDAAGQRDIAARGQFAVEEAHRQAFEQARSADEMRVLRQQYATPSLPYSTATGQGMNASGTFGVGISTNDILQQQLEKQTAALAEFQAVRAATEATAREAGQFNRVNKPATFGGSGF